MLTKYSVVVSIEALGELVREIIATPQGIIVFLIQFTIGLLLGYLVVKALKYILAIVALLVLGSMLSVWSLEGLSKSTLERLGLTLETLKSVVFALMTILVGPVAVGFIIGVIVGILRR